MSAQKTNIVPDFPVGETPAEGAVNDLTAKLLPVIARKKAASNFPTHAGASFFYELEGGWETRILEKDSEVCKVRSALQLEEAFADPKVKTILIPGDAGITRTVAMRICERHGLGKTVFFEVSQNEQR